MQTKDGQALAELIKKAIEDHVITTAEYDRIHHLASMDGKIDAHERLLLAELQDMISEKIVKRVP